MDPNLHKELMERTEELRALVASSSTEAIVGMCAAYSLSRINSGDETSPLLSPTRQVFFLLGLMLTTREPEEPQEFGPEQWHQAIELLNAISSTYAFMFWPTDEERSRVTDEWRQTRKIAMPAFLHYFNSGILASIWQVSNRIRNYLTPFNAQLKATWGISATRALEIADWICAQLQESVDRLQESALAEKQARLNFLAKAQQEGWDLQRIRYEFEDSEYHLHVERLLEGLYSMFKLPLVSLQTQFGTVDSEAYWKLFVSKRGEIKSYTYLTEHNAAEDKPLFALEEDVAMTPIANSLYWAILRVGEKELINSKSKDAFYKKRDKALEYEAEETLRRLFGDTADYYSQVFETETLQFEHDLVIRWQDKLFVIEAKASPPVEPFRDPDRAVQRLKHAFSSDRGIQKAYEQADRIRKQLAKGGRIELFDENRLRVASIEALEISNVYCVCLTRDDFGPLAVDLSLLLEKEKDDPYPWAVNILDLDNLVDAWDYFGWGADKLCEYLDDRIRLHGKTLASDELEIAGFFIQHGSLGYLVEMEADLLHLPPDYSDVFDRIHEARQGGDPVEFAPTEPFFGDVRKMLAEMFSEMVSKDGGLTSDVSGSKMAMRQGRNDPCACGSGKKFKRCCGKL